MEAAPAPSCEPGAHGYLEMGSLPSLQLALLLLTAIRAEIMTAPGSQPEQHRVFLVEVEPVLLI